MLRFVGRLSDGRLREGNRFTLFEYEVYDIGRVAQGGHLLTRLELRGYHVERILLQMRPCPFLLRGAGPEKSRYGSNQQ